MAGARTTSAGRLWSDHTGWSHSRVRISYCYINSYIVSYCAPDRDGVCAVLSVNVMRKVLYPYSIPANSLG
jgi:hypothetical protein